ncbi:MAG: adenylosuccinate synthase [Deltaproteobacteria bacterium]|nr:adenylosuccinate synthase [Deltaproteobacteria bacterium]
MPVVVILGAQWGDEGKGKITDYLAAKADIIVRYQGGNNAGHTVVVGDTTYKFHLIPSGILYKDKICVLGNGVVIDPEKLIGELDGITAQGISSENLRISDQAHFILPTHRIFDQHSEDKKGEAKIGTTGRGIGPAYRDKVNRSGIRLGDPRDPVLLRQLVATHFEEHAQELIDVDWTIDRMVDYLLHTYKRLEPYVCNTPALINDTLEKGGNILLEGAQGTLLDIDHGTYPFVTSSNPTAGGACIGSGVGPTRINAIVGVAKSYTTRVGAGPFPTELFDETGALLGKYGHEFGTTTGRARRCGWLDLVALRYAMRINGITHLCITKLDVLDSFEEIKLCTAYCIGEKEFNDYPSQLSTISQVKPIYKTLKGWCKPTSAMRSFTELPSQAIAYIARIEDYLKVPVVLVSVSPERTANLIRQNIWP